MGVDAKDGAALRDLPHEFAEPRFGAHTPFFYTRDGASLDLVGLYRDAACFMVSNGPSLKNLDLDLLKKPGIMTLAINNGAATLLERGITPDFWVCVDQPSRFVKQIWTNPGIMKFIPMASFDKDLWDNEDWGPMSKHGGPRKPYQCPNVIGYRRNEKFAAHRFFTEASINWGCHKRWGGCRTVLLPAIRIPHLLGFRRLYMLGVDLNMTQDGAYHFDEGRTKHAVSNNTKTYKRILEEYGPGMAAQAPKVGYNIYNCNKSSALKCFQYVPFDKAIEAEGALCGPTEKIQTRGMYVEWNKKKNLTREQAMAKTGALK